MSDEKGKIHKEVDLKESMKGKPHISAEILEYEVDCIVLDESRLTL